MIDYYYHYHYDIYIDIDNHKFNGQSLYFNP